MIKKKYLFSVSTKYIGSGVEEEVEIEFTEEEYRNSKTREEKIDNYFQEWLFEYGNISCCIDELG